MKPAPPDIARALAAVRDNPNITATCPLCGGSAPIVATVDHAADAIALGPHRFATGMISRIDGLGADCIPMRPRCPMSWAPLSGVCDGEHAAPACSDPECYHSERPRCEKCGFVLDQCTCGAVAT